MTRTLKKRYISTRSPDNRAKAIMLCDSRDQNLRHLLFSPTHLNGMAVNWLAASVHIHSLCDLEDVVWHVSYNSISVSNLPPLFPVIQNLSKTFRQLRTFYCHSPALHGSKMTNLIKALVWNVLYHNVKCHIICQKASFALLRRAKVNANRRTLETFLNLMLILFAHALLWHLFRIHQLTDVCNWLLLFPVYVTY